MAPVREKTGHLMLRGWCIFVIVMSLSGTGFVHAFGEPWRPDPTRGVHDVHQNQGNIRRYADDDGVWQDGGLLVQTGATWTAILLRFQSQSWHTHDATGHVR